jgi:hypothetical protein
MADGRIYRYVLAYDGGTAPRPFGSVCSLAICKPKIRAAAEPGDWIIGFRSRHPGEVLYALQVSERMSFGDYWQDARFADRKPGASPYPDNIYRVDEDGCLVQEPNPVHTPQNVSRDTGVKYVLLGHRFWYFGRHSVPLPNHLMHLVHTTQGHVVHKNRRPDDCEQLANWLASWPLGIHGQPIDREIDLNAMGVKTVATNCGHHGHEELTGTSSTAAASGSARSAKTKAKVRGCNPKACR